jgi:hypothetical protein
VLLGPPDKPRRRRRRTVAIVVGVVLALVVSGAAVAGAALWYGWGTTEPEAVLPGTSVLFARVDLSPGLGQQLALANLAKKFPQQPGGDDVVNSAKQNLVKEVLAPLDFNTDIKPWLGDRIGAALWLPNGPSNPCALIALASTDDGKAGTALSRLSDSTYALSKGYAIVSRCQHSGGQGSADAAVAAAGQQSLGSRAAFADQLSSLPSGQAIVAWLDGSALNQIIASTVEPAGGHPEDFSKSAAQLAGVTVLAGVRAAGDGLELRVRVHSSTSGNDVTGRALSQLDTLPGGTIVGASVDLSAAKQMDDSLRQGLDNLPPNLFSGDNGADPNNVQRVLKDLLGSQISLSVVNPQSPAFQALVHAADATSAQDIVDALGGEADSANGSIRVSGNTVSLTSRGYAGGTGTLETDPLYRSAMANPPANVFLAAYVNVQAWKPKMDLSPDEAANIAPVKAIGLTMGVDHDTAEMLVRVVIQ